MDFTVGMVMAIILIVALVGIFAYFKIAKPTETQIAEAKEFLLGISDKLLDIINKVIDDVDAGNYLDFVEYKAEVIAVIYDQSWKYVTDTITENIEDTNLSKIVSKVITESNVYEIIETLMSDNDIGSKLTTIFNKNVKSKLDDIEAEEKAAAETAAKYESGDIETTEEDEIAAAIHDTLSITLEDEDKIMVDIDDIDISDETVEVLETSEIVDVLDELNNEVE